jgi:hypothetical protein
LATRKILGKIKTSDTHPEDNNYWTPLQQEENEEEEESKQINMTHTLKATTKGNKWMQRATR